MGPRWPCALGHSLPCHTRLEGEPGTCPVTAGLSGPDLGGDALEDRLDVGPAERKRTGERPRGGADAAPKPPGKPVGGCALPNLRRQTKGGPASARPPFIRRGSRHQAPSGSAEGTRRCGRCGQGQLPPRLPQRPLEDVTAPNALPFLSSSLGTHAAFRTRLLAKAQKSARDVKSALRMRELRRLSTFELHSSVAQRVGGKCHFHLHQPREKVQRATGGPVPAERLHACCPHACGPRFSQPAGQVAPDNCLQAFEKQEGLCFQIHPPEANPRCAQQRGK